MTEILKSTRPRVDQEKLIAAAQFGGTVRFPSGHLETFLMARDGFLSLRDNYLLFLWKPVRSDDTYVVAEAYGIQDGRIFAVDLDSQEAAYDGMPFEQFKAKVKSAIAKNVDTN